MSRSEHYMQTHPIELHRAANIELIGSRINKDLTDTRSDLRETKLMTRAAVLLMGLCTAGAVYEVGTHVTEARYLAAAGAISGLGAFIGIRGGSVLEEREAHLSEQLQTHSSYIEVE